MGARHPVEPLSHAGFEFLHAPFDVSEVRTRDSLSPYILLLLIDVPVLLMEQQLHRPSYVYMHQIPCHSVLWSIVHEYCTMRGVIPYGFHLSNCGFAMHADSPVHGRSTGEAGNIPKLLSSA